MLRVEIAALLFAAGVLGSSRAPKSDKTGGLLARAASPFSTFLFLAARISVLVGLGALAGEIGIDLSDSSAALAKASTLVAAFVGLVLAVIVAGVVADPALAVRRRFWDRLTDGGVRGIERLTTSFSPLPEALRGTLRMLMAGGMDGLVPSSVDAAAVVLAVPSGGADLGMLALFCYGVGGLATRSAESRPRRLGAATAFVALALTYAFGVL